MIEERKLKKEIKIPEGVSVAVDGRTIIVKGPLGELKREIKEPSIKLESSPEKLTFRPTMFSKKQKMLINTNVAHFKNMLKGVREEYVYKMKICSGHFPMSVSVDGSNVIVKNFFGEKVARKANILLKVKVEIKGDIVTISGIDIEAVGQTAANIESCTKVTNRDRRVFQDGIWLFEKAGKKVNA